MRTELSLQRKLRRMLVAAAIIGAVALAPAISSAEGLLDFFFGGGQKQQHQTSFFTNLFNNNNPQPLPPRPVVASSGPVFCVRSCDGKYQFGEVGKRSRQPVYLVDDDNIDLAGADVVQQPPEVRPVGRPTRVAAVIIARPHQSPAGDTRRGRENDSRFCLRMIGEGPVADMLIDSSGKLGAAAVSTRRSHG